MGVRTIVVAAVGCSLCLWAELLPIRSYSTADGLAANRIDRIVVDSRGFVWLCTPEGLSRFDGYRVANFGTAEGLPSRGVQAFLETRSGAYFVATGAGLSQFQAAVGKKQFVTYRVGDSPRDNNVTALLQSSDGRIWCGTWGALFEMLPGPRFRRQSLPKPPPEVTGIDITDIAEDRCGKLWLGTVTGAYIVARDGAVQRITKDDGLPSDYINTLLPDRDGRLWAGLRGGLALLRDGCTAGSPGVQQVYPLGRNVMSLVEGSGGVLWAGTINGLFRLLPGGSESFQRLTRSQGLSDRAIFSLASDRAGNIWAGTEGAGAMMIQPAGFTTYRERDGFTSDRVWSVLGDRAGNVLAVAGTEDQAAFSLSVFDGSMFHSQKAPRIFATYRNHRAWGSHRILLQSRTGEWWAATAGGLCRYRAVKAEGLADLAPEKCYFREETIFQIFEDSQGGIWTSAQAPGPLGDRLLRWDPGTRAIVRFQEWPQRDALVKSFAEDRQGNIWMGLWGTGGLYRYDGRRFTNFSPQDGVPAGTVYALLVDSVGRLWMGTDNGLGVVENPAAAPFRVRTYDQASGLSSNSVAAILDDREGYLYAATGSGVDRLDPKTGHIKHFSAADGVALGQMESAYRDNHGNLWFATAQGLSRLTPGASPPPANPAVLITSLQAGGAPVAVSERGETSISGIRLDPFRNQLQVEFVALSGEPEADLRYTYKLEGADSAWSAPEGQHVVNFAALGAGKYRFLVKAVDSAGQESAAPAEVDFTVLPPFWRRWWFEGLALAALASVVYLLHTYRVSQVVNLERMRTAIATDLHDDIGSSLSQIAVLSEVARAGVNGENRRTQESLQRVAVLARELVDSMGDIVWSIRAVPDGLDSLVSRMREFAFDLLAGQGIGFQLQSPPAGDDAHLSLQARRHLFLMFKECLHNAARHSGCTAVKAELFVVGREILLTVDDNGRGWEPKEQPPGSAGGNGIPGMRQRAAILGGSVQLVSKPGRGCTVSISLPLARGPFARYRA